MFRQVSSRNHRNKGLKVKHALQIFLLIAVCLWLLYQVKHSHDEKKAFEERNAHEMQNRQDILKLGRKDLNHNGQISSGHGLNDQSEEGKEGEEEEVDDESKQEENDQEENDQEDGTEEDTDENDEEKSEEESETHEDTVEEESEKKKEGEGDEHEQREVNEEKTERNEQEESEESKGNAHQAREAHYTGDDASSAVVKLDTERATELNVEKSDDEHKERIDIENSFNDTSNHTDEMMSNSTSDSTLSQDKNADNSTFLTIEKEEIPGNVTMGTEVKGGNLQLPTIESEARNNITAERVQLEPHLDTSGNKSLSDSTTTGGVDQILNENRLVETDSENATLPLGKGASVESNNLDQNSTSETVNTSEQDNALAVTGNISVVDHNATSEIEKIIGQDSLNLRSNVPEPEQQLNTTTEESMKVIAKNTTLEAGEGQAENLKASEDSGDSGDPSMDDKLEIDAIKPEKSQTAEVTHEVREALTDLGTLPEIDTHGQSIEDVAAE